MISAKEFTDLMPNGRLLGSEEPEMESSLHYLQALILVTCLEWLWRDHLRCKRSYRQDFFIGANLTVYFSR